MAAVMSNEVANTEKISIFVNECLRLGITILAPDVNKSGLKFVPGEVNAAGVAAAQAARKVKQPVADAEATIEEDGVRFDDLPAAGDPAAKADAPLVSGGEKIHVGSIRFGLAAIKNVGESAMESAVEERGRSGVFKSLEDFCGRIDSKKLNKKSLECLVKCGAFDWLGVERAALFSEIEGAFAAAASSHRDRASGQVSLFDAFDAAPAPAKRSSAPHVPPWSTAEKLAFEKELLGFYVTGHPLDDYRPALESGKYVPIARLGEQEDKSTVSIAGALTSVEKKFTKKDSKPFAVVVIEDLTASMEVMIWSEAYNKAQNHLVLGNVVTITGRLDRREEAPRISASEVKPLKKPAPADKTVVLLFQTGTTEQDLATVREIVAQFPGSRGLELRFLDDRGNRLRLRAAKDIGISLTAESQQRLAPWLTA
jgi:DNA polymerase-3 subunit alpha